MRLFKKILKVFKNLILSFGKKNPNVMTSEETVNFILDNGVSIGRFGDGELEIINGNGIKFQEYDKILSKKLSILKNSDKFLVCIPNIFNKHYCCKDYLIDSEYKFWTRYKLKSSYKWKNLFNNQVCGDSLLSRFYMRYKDKSKVADYIKLFKRLWDKRNIIIVEGESSKVGCENDLLNNAASVRRIICPSKNAFSYYDQILNSIKKNYKNGDLVIMALGPTATVLAYDLSREGIQALDLGHFDIEYEWFLLNATEKTPIKNKHVNECDSDGDGYTKDEIYYKQIVLQIKE